MTLTFLPAVGAAGLALAVLPFLVPSAVADSTTPGSKAQIEYAERSAAGLHPSKAQAERDERERASFGRGRAAVGREGTTRSAPGGSDSNDAAAWQLALGAAVTGGAVLVSARVVSHKPAVAR